MATGSVIFLKKSDAPISNVAGIPLNWEMIGRKTYVLQTENKAVIAYIRSAYIEPGTDNGNVSEITPEELEVQKKRAPKVVRQVHAPPDMRVGMSGSDPTGLHRNQPQPKSLDDVVDSGSVKHSVYHETAPLATAPKTVRMADLEDAP
jgi:hypothetical protein